MKVEHPRSVVEYLNRIGAEVLNFRRAMVKVHKGAYYVERALVRIDADGVVTCSVKELEPTDEEARAMAEELAQVKFPRSVLARNADGLRARIGAQAELFEFWNRKGGGSGESDGLIMCQERRIQSNGVKRYVPWVMMDDGEWVSMEPDGDLPFWKPREGRGPGCRIMIHEGAKAARAAQMIAEGRDGFRDHPWATELAEYEHWGMIGGALAPHRTDYAELAAQSPTEVVYVQDNDFAGESALQKVSKHWGRSMKGVRFGKNFPEAWDLGDEMPENLFVDGRYVGPMLSGLMEPATWATEIVPPPKGQRGKGTTKVTADFASEWFHVVSPEVFIHRDWPSRVYDVGQFDNLMAPFSHVMETARVLKRENASKVKGLKYNPALPPGVYDDASSGHYINTYAPSGIMAEKGDVSLWEDFMSGLIPGETDRFEAMRWIATLIARPDVRMLYGLLLISETQGIGKGTLGERVLTPLVGASNVSFPSEEEIVDSDYNYWVAHKRLAVVHEIYAGQSSKAYNKLKSVITDKYVTVKKKYQPNYEMECWVHIIACSNSLRALKLSMDDRRWFIPRLSEKKRPQAFWEKFNDWLAFGGGLGVIKWWAERFVAEHGPVTRGESAPWSESKRDIVEEGYSPGQAHVMDVLTETKRLIEAGELPRDSFVLDAHLVQSIREVIHQGKADAYLEKPMTVRALAKSMGWFVGDRRSEVAKWPRGARIISLDPDVAGMSATDLNAAGRAPLNVARVMGAGAM